MIGPKMRRACVVRRRDLKRTFAAPDTPLPSGDNAAVRSVVRRRRVPRGQRVLDVLRLGMELETEELVTAPWEFCRPTVVASIAVVCP